MKRTKYVTGDFLEPIPTTPEFQFSDLKHINKVSFSQYLFDNEDDARAEVRLVDIKQDIKLKSDGFISSLAKYSTKTHSVDAIIKVDLSLFRPARTKVNINRDEDWRIQLIMMDDQ